MYQVLSEYQGLVQMMETETDKDTNSVFENVDIRRAVNKVESNYHPLEINQWKYASYLYHAKAYEKAEIYFQKAYHLCIKYRHYTTMNIVGIGILAERICCCIDSAGLQTAQKHYKELLLHIDRILDENLPAPTKDFLSGLREMEELLSNNNQRAALNHFKEKKGGYSADGMPVSELEEYWKVNKQRIKDELNRGSYAYQQNKGILDAVK